MVKSGWEPIYKRGSTLAVLGQLPAVDPRRSGDAQLLRASLRDRVRGRSARRGPWPTQRDRLSSSLHQGLDLIGALDRTRDARQSVATEQRLPRPLDLTRRRVVVAWCPDSPT